MFCSYTRPRYQVSVYRPIGPLDHIFTGDKTDFLSPMAFSNKYLTGN